jgi:hypothetical protein
MTLHLAPTVKVVRLSNTQPGDLVIYDKAFCFVCVSATDPDKHLRLAAVDVATPQFALWFFSVDIDVLALGPDIVIAPVIDAAITPTPPAANSGLTLFLNGVAPIAVVTIGGSREWRMLDLSSGTISTASERSFPAFPHWQLGVKDGSDGVTWLKTV